MKIKTDRKNWLRNLLLGAALAPVSFFIFAGCATNNSQQQAINITALTFASQALASADVIARPQDLPALQTVQGVICGIAGNTNAAPGAINAALYNLGVGGRLGAIINANLPNLMALVSELEASNTNSVQIRVIAGAVCNGMTAGIAAAQTK